MSRVAADFVERLFTYDPRVYENGREAALEMVIGKAKKKMVQQQTENLYDEFEEQDKIIASLVNITDSVYNKTGNDTAVVTIQFEQELDIDRIRSRTMNEVKVWMRFITDGWKIENYEFKQVL